MNATDHTCPWRDEVLELREALKARDAVIAEYAGLRSQLDARDLKIAQYVATQAKQTEQLEVIQGQLATLQHRVFSGGRDKMPSPADALKRATARGKRGTSGKRKDGKKARKTNAAARAKAPVREFMHHVRDEDKGACLTCGEPASRTLGEGQISTIFELVPAHIEQHRHIRETLACGCGAHIVTADGPAKVVDKGRYGPALMAHIITSKCADSLPLYRIAKRYHRQGVPIARSTIGALFHSAAFVLTPLYDLIFKEIAAQAVVQADETPMPIQARGKCTKGYLWTFLAAFMIGYRFSGSRSSATPLAVLGGTPGALVVDAYGGYNSVCTPDSRKRCGCLAHARRKFFEARKSAPDIAERAMALILEVYRVEHEMKEADLVRTPTHQAARDTRSRAAMNDLRKLIDEERGNHTPKKPIGKALGYAHNQWEELTCFLDDVMLPVDNNASERALRVVTLGRKNFMFVGNVDAGQNLAVLYTLVATCELHGVNPLAYLTDVLPQVQHTRVSQLPALLPWNWRQSDGETAEAATAAALCA